VGLQGTWGRDTSVVFTFGLAIESIKELGGASTMKKHVTNEHGPDLMKYMAHKIGVEGKR